MPRRFLTGVLAALLLASPMLTAAPEAHAADLYQKRSCSFQRVDPGYWTQRENRLTVNCFARKFGVSVYMADLIASHESGFNRMAYNSSSCAEGLFQFLCTGWQYRVMKHAKALHRYDVHDLRWDSPRAQAVIAVATAKAVGWYSNWCRWAYYC